MTKILLVEDDHQVLDMLQKTLERAGYQVTTAHNGREAMTSFRAAPVKVVITDIIMPEKEGIETIYELKRDFPEVKIIAISGGSSRSRNYLNTARVLGAERALSKPFGRADLLEAVAELLQ